MLSLLAMQATNCGTCLIRENNLISVTSDVQMVK